MPRVIVAQYALIFAVFVFVGTLAYLQGHTFIAAFMAYLIGWFSACLVMDWQRYQRRID